MAKISYPVTPAIRELREKNIDFGQFLYEYTEKGGTRQTAELLGVDEYCVIKTLVFDSDVEPIIVLMHGTKEVSQKEMARIISARKVEPASADVAMKLTGYQFGGTSPFGTRKKFRIFAEATIFELDRVYINGGKRGFIISISTGDLMLALSPELVHVALDK